MSLNMSSASRIHARFLVVLDDKLGEPAKAARNGLSRATKAPQGAAATLLRRRISRNDFSFELLAFEGVCTRDRKKTWFGLGRDGGPVFTPVTKFEYKLDERAGGKSWAVDFVWHVAAAPGTLDTAAFKHYLEVQLSDGWGEGVEQIRFGPLVRCSDRRTCRLAKKDRAALSPDLDGRYSFNLTTVGAGAVAPHEL